VEHLDRLARATGRSLWTELFMTPTENPASTSPTGDRHTAGWIGLAARRSLLALRLIADSERIVGTCFDLLGAEIIGGFSYSLSNTRISDLV